MEKGRVAVIVAEYFRADRVVLLLNDQSKGLLDVVVLTVTRSSSWQIHCAAPKDSLSASAASENFLKVLAVATDLGVLLYV